MSLPSNKGSGPTLVGGHILAAIAIILFLCLSFRWLVPFACLFLFYGANEKLGDVYERISYRKGLKKKDPGKSKNRW